MAHLDRQIISDSITGPAQCTLINRLPNELLLEVFILHVWANYRSPVGLILVCKRWKVVSSSSSLWTNIFYGHANPLRLVSSEKGEICHCINGMIHCSTPEQLETAIRKTKSAKFELTIHIRPYQAEDLEDLANIVKKAITNRCRLFRIVTPSYLNTESRESYQTLVSYLGKLHFKALEELILVGSHFKIIAARLAKNLYANSPRLRNISTPLLENWINYTQLLPRVTKLSVQNVEKLFYDKTAGKGTFEKLEELTIEDRIIHITRKEWRDILPMPALKKVTLKTGYLSDLPIDVYAQITHLTIECAYAGRNELDKPFYLPSLTDLHLKGFWGLLGQLDAPKLVTLLLDGQTRWNVAKPQGTDTVKSIHQSRLLPEILIIHKTMSQDDLTKFVSTIGAKLKELSITHVRRDDTICKQLISALVGSKRKEPICSLLRKFETISPKFGPKAEGLYEATRQRLQQVIDVRAPYGTLTRVRSGFYPLSDREHGDQRWWNIEWEDLLWV